MFQNQERNMNFVNTSDIITDETVLVAKFGLQDIAARNKKKFSTLFIFPAATVSIKNNVKF